MENQSQKAQGNLHQVDIIKTKNFCLQKTMLAKMKRLAIDERKHCNSYS
jgi:hypothetical protein